MTTQPKYLWGKLNPEYQGPEQAQGSNLDIYESPAADFHSKMTESEKVQMLDKMLQDMQEWDNPHSCEHDAQRSMAASAKAALSQESRSEVGEFISNASSPDGGGSWSPVSGISPDHGFMYSPYEERSTVIDSVDDLSSASILSYVDENSDLLEKDDHYLGIWNDPSDGKIYVDVSVRTMDADEARKGCEDHDQIAFFDLQTFESVTVNQNATSGQ